MLDLERDQARTTDAITTQAIRAVREDHAEVICLGCAGMVGLDEKSRPRPDLRPGVGSGCLQP